MRPEKPNRIDLSQRSRKAEMIDSPERLSAAEMAVTLHELALVNRWLGGSRTCLQPLRPLILEISSARPRQPVRLVDFGSGGADILIDLAEWARRRGCPLRITAVDFNEAACRVARQSTGRHPGIAVVCADAFRQCFRPGAFDIALFSAFLHHFSDQEIVEILSECRRTVQKAIVINDLQRSRWAYLGIRLLTALLSQSEAVKNDGPLSVRKGFRRSELLEILSAAGFSQVRIAWKWAFRYAVTVALDR